MGAASLPARAQPVSVDAIFLHPQAANPYQTVLAGRITLAAEKSRLSFRLGLGDESCRLRLRWISKRSTAAVETCLARGDVDEVQFNDWIRTGRSSIDPTFAVPVSQDPQTQGRFVNDDVARGALFIRDCQKRYRKYADLVIAPRALELTVRGSLRIRVSDLRIEAGASWPPQCLPEEAPDAPWPVNPVNGFSQSLIGVSASLAPAGDPIHQSLNSIRDEIEDLYWNDILKWNEAAQLVRPTDNADARQREVSPSLALISIDQLEQQSSRMARSGSLPAQNAKSLFDGIASIRRAIVERLAPIHVQPPPKCGFDGGCTSELLYVDSATRTPVADRDGTRARPFASIAAALEASASHRACGVVVQVSRGTYRDDLTITRDTAIVGQPSSGREAVVIRGSIESGPYRLFIENVSFVETPGAAIHAANRCALTTLQGVSIDSALNFGIDIDGGSLSANDVRVTATRGRLSVISSGVGIRLRGGARAAMSAVSLDNNAGQGIAVIGENSKAFARAFSVSNNHFLGGLVGLLGGVSALDGGLLLMETSVIEDGEAIGLHASNHGRIHFRSGRVDRTRREHTPGSPAGAGFGINAAAHFNAVLELNTFVLAEGELAGAQYAAGALGVSRDGVVKRSPIGANVQDTPLGRHLNCIADDTRYVDNDLNLDSEDLPVPGRAVLSLRGARRAQTETTEDCASVPWVCDWCVD